MKIVNIANKGRTIYLFCRDNQGNQVIEIDKDYYPHYYEPDPNGKFISYDGVKLKKIICNLPYDVIKQKSSLSYASDIKYTTLYMIDKVSSIEVCPIKKLFIDIEVDSSGDSFPDPELASWPITCITLYNSFDKSYKTYFIDDYKGSTILKKEDMLLTDFLQEIKNANPDLLVGWNINGFDYPYLYNRFAIKGIDFSKEISVIGSSRMGKKDFPKVFYPNGISILDLMGLYKKFTLKKKRSYSLDYIAQEDLGYDSFDINKKGFGKEKNIIDVKKTVELDEKYKVIDYFNIIRIMAKCNWEDLPMEVIKTEFGVREQSNNSKIVDCLLLQEAKIKNVILPSKSFGSDSYSETGSSNEDDIDGAFREAYETGLFNEGLGKYDLSSAYPSAIMDFCLDSANIRSDDELNDNCIKIDLFDRELNKYTRTLYYEQNQDALIPSLVRKFIKIKDKLKDELNSLDTNSEDFKQSTTKYNAIKSIINSCFTEDTFIVTSQGIKNIKNIEVGDVVYNVNPDTLEVELDEVVETQELDYKGYLYNYKTDCADLKVTGDHRFLLSKSSTNNYIFFSTAEEIYKELHKFKFKKSCKWVIPKIKPILNYETSPITEANNPFDVVIDQFYTSIMEGNNAFKIYASKRNPSFVAQNNFKQFSRENFTREEYQGKVYCLTTKKNKTVFAGRNNCFTLVGQCYGVIGNSYFRLFDERVANTITFLVRDLLLNIKDRLQADNKNVVYADTDSIFVRHKGNMTNELNTMVQDWAIKKYNNPKVSVKFDFEGTFTSIIIYAKCMYYGYIETKKGTKLEKKGLQLVKSSSSKYEATFQKELLEKVLKGKTREEIIKWIYEEKDKIKTLPLMQIAFPSKLPNKKLLNNPIHYRAYNNTKMLDNKFALRSGDLFYYIFINSLGKTSSDKDLDVLAFTEENSNIIDRDRIDWKKVIDRNINNKSDTLFEVLKWKTKKSPMLIHTLDL